MVLKQQESDRQEPESLLSTEQETRLQLPTEIPQNNEYCRLSCQEQGKDQAKDFAEKKISNRNRTDHGAFRSPGLRVWQSSIQHHSSSLWTLWNISAVVIMLTNCHGKKKDKIKNSLWVSCRVTLLTPPPTTPLYPQALPVVPKWHYTQVPLAYHRERIQRHRGNCLLFVCDQKNLPLRAHCIPKQVDQQPRSQGPLSSYLKKVPWLGLVTCLLDFSRFQRCDSREGLES